MKLKQTGRRTIYVRCVWKRVLNIACLFFLTVLSVSICFARSKGIGSNGTRGRIFITAHRGASYRAPENTWASVALAIAEKADYVEIDVRMTADGVPVLMHDRALFRTTGIVNEIDKVTYKEVSFYDAGVRYGEAFRGETVPGLEEILKEYGRKIKFNIELKESNNPNLVRAVVGLVEAYGLEGQCMITSESYVQIERVKKANAEIKTGYILSRVYGEIYGYEAADFFSVKSEYVTEQMVKGAHEKGKEIHVWTVNKEYELIRMRDLGVDNIITDKPAYAKEILQGSNI